MEYRPRRSGWSGGQAFELRRCPLFELRDGLRPARDESWVDPAGRSSS